MYRKIELLEPIQIADREVMYSSEDEFTLTPCVVEKAVELDENDFLDFSRNQLEDRDYISAHKDATYWDDDNHCHCLLILGKDFNGGYIIDAAGYDCAVFASFVPRARQIMEETQRQNDGLVRDIDGR